MVMIPFIGFSFYAKQNMLGFTDSETPFYIWNKLFCYTTQEEKIDVIILGDSTANASYMPEVLSGSTVNLALGGTTPMENYYVLQNYLDHNDAPEDVFISFMDSHLSISDWYWTRSLYSHRFSFKDNWEMLQQARKFDEKSITRENEYLDFLAYELYLPSKYITSMRNASFNQRLVENSIAFEAVDIHSGRYMAVGNDESSFEGAHYDEFYVGPLFDYYYKKLICLCIENGSNVHIVKLPLPATSSFSYNYRKQFYDYYNQLQEEYPSITVDWFSEGYDNRNFIDGGHMNTHGAFKFSEILKAEYPQAFDSALSDKQKECLDQDVRDENKIEELVKWCKNDRYTLIVYDNRGDFETMYENIFKQEILKLKRFVMNGNETNIYILGASEYASQFDSIILNDKEIEIYPNRNVDANSMYLWDTSECNGIDAIVINNEDGSVVTEKKFDYIEDSYFVLR